MKAPEPKELNSKESENQHLKEITGLTLPPSEISPESIQSAQSNNLEYIKTLEQYLEILNTMLKIDSDDKIAEIDKSKQLLELKEKLKNLKLILENISTPNILDVVMLEKKINNRIRDLNRKLGILRTKTDVVQVAKKRKNLEETRKTDQILRNKRKLPKYLGALEQLLQFDINQYTLEQIQQMTDKLKPHLLNENLKSDKIIAPSDVLKAYVEGLIRNCAVKIIKNINEITNHPKNSRFRQDLNNTFIQAEMHQIRELSDELKLPPKEELTESLYQLKTLLKLNNNTQGYTREQYIINIIELLKNMRLPNTNLTNIINNITDSKTPEGIQTLTDTEKHAKYAEIETLFAEVINFHAETTKQLIENMIKDLPLTMEESEAKQEPQGVSIDDLTRPGELTDAFNKSTQVSETSNPTDLTIDKWPHPQKYLGSEVSIDDLTRPGELTDALTKDLSYNKSTQVSETLKPTDLTIDKWPHPQKYLGSEVSIDDLPSQGHLLQIPIDAIYPPSTQGLSSIDSTQSSETLESQQGKLAPIEVPIDDLPSQEHIPPIEIPMDAPYPPNPESTQPKNFQYIKNHDDDLFKLKAIIAICKAIKSVPHKLSEQNLNNILYNEETQKVTFSDQSQQTIIKTKPNPKTVQGNIILLLTFFNQKQRRYFFKNIKDNKIENDLIRMAITTKKFEEQYKKNVDDYLNYLHKVLDTRLNMELTARYHGIYSDPSDDFIQMQRRSERNMNDPVAIQKELAALDQLAKRQAMEQQWQHLDKTTKSSRSASYDSRGKKP